MHYAFLHGGGQGSWVWSETIAALDQQTAGEFGRALALDVPGCGVKRGRATEGSSLNDVAAELIGDLQTAGMSDVVLVGHSQAGQAMSLMVQQRPDLFRRLIHVSCSIPLPGQTVTQMLGTSRQGEVESEVGWPFDPMIDSISDRYATMFCNDMDPLHTASFLAKLGADSWPMQTYRFSDWRHEPHAAVPASFVICLQDNILPPKWQETFADRFRADRRIRLDAGHQAMSTRSHALAEILRHEAS
jgi:pimeloyl-ACP methyl ester carboxylesterase